MRKEMMWGFAGILSMGVFLCELTQINKKEFDISYVLFNDSRINNWLVQFDWPTEKKEPNEFASLCEVSKAVQIDLDCF